MRFKEGEPVQRYRQGVLVIGRVISSGTRMTAGFEGAVLVTWETLEGLITHNYEEDLRPYRILPQLVHSKA